MPGSLANPSNLHTFKHLRPNSQPQARVVSRLSNTEDNFVERKRLSDDRVCLRTVVGVADSRPTRGAFWISVF